MALLDLQGMELPREKVALAASTTSVATCRPSCMSIIFC